MNSSRCWNAAHPFRWLSIGAALCSMPLGAHAEVLADIFVGRANGSAFTDIYNAGTLRYTYLTQRLADVDGDGKSDIVAFGNGAGYNGVDVGLSSATFAFLQPWSDYFCVRYETCATGDVNGDGKADLITFVKTNGQPNSDDVYVALSNGQRFSSPQKWSDYFCVLSEVCAVGDVNGDGKADLITFVKTNGQSNTDDVYVALSNGQRFSAPQKWNDYFCVLGEVCAVGDVNGDGKADLITFVKTNGQPNSDDVYVALSDGQRFSSPQKWSDYFCVLSEVCAVGDVNGDGKADLITFVKTNGQPNSDDVYVALSNGQRFSLPQKWSDYFCVQDETCLIGDMDGDRRSDVVAIKYTQIIH